MQSMQNGKERREKYGLWTQTTAMTKLKIVASV